MNAGDPLITQLEQHVAACTGDVPALVAATAAVHPGFSDPLQHARALDVALAQRAAAGDRNGAWWCACAAAVVRASPLTTPQEDAELAVARVFGELSQSAAARGPLPEGARWMVAAYPEPPPTGHALELARKNAATYAERLDAELQGRVPTLLARVGAAPSTLTVAYEVLASYAAAAANVRASMVRVGDRCVASDPTLAPMVVRAVAELDDAVLAGLLGRVAEARAALGEVGAAPAVKHDDSRTSFVGAAPPSFEHRDAAPVASTPPAPMSGATIEQLEAAMRTAFERAWATRDPNDRTAFEHAVRARYTPEVANIPDPEQQRKALEHYVSHALSQLT